MDFSEKRILERDDRKSLSAFAEEFRLLDRFNVESLEKRKLLLTGLASAAVGGIGGIGGTHLVRPALRKVNWRYVSFTHKNKNHTNDPASNYQFILTGAMGKLTKLVDRMTEGKFIIKPYSETYLTSSDNLLGLISNSNEIDCGIAGIYFSQINRGLYFGTGVPFGLNPEEQTAWLEYKREGKNKTFMEEVYEKYGFGNIVPIPLIATGQQMGGFFKKK